MLFNKKNYAPTLLLLLFAMATPALAEFENFIVRDGHRLLDGDEEFRFAGIHATELHRIEDDARGSCPQDSRVWGQYFLWPTADEQENWIKSLIRVGQKATRMYVLSVEQEYDEACGRETHILAPASPGGMPRLNEDAMVHFDRMIALADEHGVRLIIPFIDHWWWWGGREQLAAFYDETADDFYRVSSATFAAYLNIIEQVLTRRNTITGRLYSEEKAIMAWETGNELLGTNEAFLSQTAALIRSLAPNHLVADGTYQRINSYALSNPDVDIVTNHYPGSASRVLADLQEVDGQKAYFVGEFGLGSLSSISAVMDAVVEANHNDARAFGGLIWGLRGHRHNGGFYWHREQTGTFSYHYPGFPENDYNDEQAVVDLVRDAAATMAGLSETPMLPVPEAPKLRDIESLQSINWMGAPVGRFYRVERAESEDGPWQTVAENISDGENRYDPEVDTLFSDDTADESRTYYYRVFASNESGESIPSNIVAYNAEASATPSPAPSASSAPEASGGGGSSSLLSLLLLAVLGLLRGRAPRN